LPFANNYYNSIKDTKFQWIHDVHHQFACDLCSNFVSTKRPDSECEARCLSNDGTPMNRKLSDSDYMTGSRKYVSDLLKDPCKNDNSDKTYLASCADAAAPSKINGRIPKSEVDVGKSEFGTTETKNKQSTKASVQGLQGHSNRPTGMSEGDEKTVVIDGDVAHQMSDEITRLKAEVKALEETAKKTNMDVGQAVGFAEEEENNFDSKSLHILGVVVLVGTALSLLTYVSSKKQDDVTRILLENEL